MTEEQIIQLISDGTWQTLYMTFVSVFFSYLLGLPLGVILVATGKDGITPMPVFNNILGTIVNVVRSVPFLILMITLIPVSRFIVGTSIGSNAAIVSLVIAAVPFIGRMVESSLLEIDHGVIEAAQSMGASPLQIIFKVMIPEAVPSLITGAAIASTTILGYSAMAGAVGAEGLGALAIRFGYHRSEPLIMYITLIVLVFLVQFMQFLGDYMARKCDHRK
ncbi:MAG: ABC transporter permease [Peptococcaceae bacterium]|jgi:D-methionine transport system permease protein|nr:ABC transporter permease [Peptococcaceae bacterium]